MRAVATETLEPVKADRVAVATGDGPKAPEELSRFLEFVKEGASQIGSVVPTAGFEAATTPSPAAGILLLPVVSPAGLESLLCVQLDAPSPPPTLGQMESLRRLCQAAGAVLAALWESDDSRGGAAAPRGKAADLPGTAEQPAEETGRIELLWQIRSRVLSNAIHELRTPLVAVRGYTQLLLEEQAGPINEKQNEYLTVVLENTAKLVDLLNHLQELPLPDQLRLEVIDLKKLWRESLEPLRAAAARKSINLVERVAEEPLIVAGDREKLGLVFRRLLANAVKFTNAGGEIRTDICSEPDQIVIRISDTGDGIPPEFTDETFGRGERRSDAASSPSAGAPKRPIVHEIVRMHGGRISVTSALGEGCTAVLTLPVFQFVSPEAQRYGQTPSSGSR